MDLRDAAQQTRISASFLAAIEAEEFSRLPGEVFVKGFLKNYARFLRLSEDEVMKRYAELRTAAAAQMPAAQKAEPDERERPERPAASQPVRPAASVAPERNVEPFVWGGVILAALVVFIIIARPAQRPAIEHKAPSSAGTQNGMPATVPSPSGMPDKIYLDIEALEDTWVLVRTDSSPQKHAVLTKGESVTWSADERFLLSFGSAGAARLLLNGKELAVAGPRNAVVRDLIVTAKGIEQQKAEPEKPRKPRPPQTAVPQAASRPAETAPAPPPAPPPASEAPAGPAPQVPAAPQAPEG